MKNEGFRLRALQFSISETSDEVPIQSAGNRWQPGSSLFDSNKNSEPESK